MRWHSVPLMVVSMIALNAMPAHAQNAKPKVAEVTMDAVKNCRPLGQVLGEYQFCNVFRRDHGRAADTNAGKDAMTQAATLGATHIVFVTLRCVTGVGLRATARIFDCSKDDVSLDDVYEDYLGMDPTMESRTVAWQSAPKVVTSRNLDFDAADLSHRGYILVGYAGVEGGKVLPEAVKKKAVSVRAELVLIQTEASGEILENQVVTSQQGGGASIGISSGTGTATVGQTGVLATGLATTITSVPGTTSTQVVPYSRRQFDTQILFWRKLKAGRLGLFTAFLPPELRTKYSRNTGAYVVAVEDGSPAFFANIVVGDVVCRVDGVEIRTPAELDASLAAKTGSPLTLHVLRAGEFIDIEISEPAPNIK